MRYLNSEGIESLAVIGFMSGVLSDIRNRVAKQDWNKDTRKTVSQAATWTDKAYSAICNELDAKQGKLLINRLNSWRGSKFDIIRPSITKGTNIETVEIEKEDFYNMICHIIDGGCTKCSNPNECQFKELLLKYDVPISNNKHDCPYWNEKPEPISDIGLKLVKSGISA